MDIKRVEQVKLELTEMRKLGMLGYLSDQEFTKLLDYAGAMDAQDDNYDDMSISDLADMVIDMYNIT